MRIGFLGTGAMTVALGARFLRAGHSVTVGSRSAQRAASIASALGGGATGGNHRAAADCEAVVVAVHDGVALDLVAELRDALAGRVLIDLGNPLDPPHWESRLAGGPSLAERMAEAAPEARVAKAFNTVYAELLALPEPDRPAPQTFVASDHDDARQVVLQLARDAATEPMDVGPLRMARHLEALAGIEVALAERCFGTAVAVRIAQA